MANAYAPLISVVMPCFNVERYVGEAIASVQAQGMADWELIAVDDCSTDETLGILKEAAAGDERIRVVPLSENGGAGAARMRGLAEAHGEFVAFFDSDDVCDLRLFELLRRHIAMHDPDLAVWGVLEEYSNESGMVYMTREVVSDFFVCETPGEVHKRILDLEQKTLFGYVWNKLYRRTMLVAQGVSFERVAINEDIFFNIDVARGVRSMVVIGEPLYRYARRDAGVQSSLTAKFLPDYFELSSRRVREMLDLYRGWGEETDEVRRVLATIYLRYSISALQRNCDARANMNAVARRAWLNEWYELPLSRLCVRYAQPEGKAARAFACMMRRGSRTLLLAAARVVHVVSAHAPGLFSRLKQSR